MDVIGLVAAAAAALVAATPGGPAPPGGRWQWPVGDGGRPPLVAPFDAPDARWGPGHRGLDLGAGVGAPVRAVADGRVTHRGRVAGRPTISVLHDGGIRSTYEPVDSDLAVGDVVARGEVVGHLGDERGHCVPRACLHLGAVSGSGGGAAYVDPLPFFGERRVILLPVR